MEFYCTDVFCKELRKLKKKKSYRDLDKIIIEKFLKVNDDLLSNRGTNLNRNHEQPYIRYANKPSAYRFYYFVFIEEKKLFLHFLHPKTGTSGAPTVTEEFISNSHTELENAIINKDIYKIGYSNNKLTFK